MITEDSIFISAKLPLVYSIACDLEKQHEFIPGYKPAEIRKEADGSMIVTRNAEINGKVMTWKSAVSFRDNRSIDFEQVEGRLKGMRIRWLFTEAPGGTHLTITHDLKFHVPVIGWLAERMLAKPAIDKLTANVLKGLKSRIEDSRA
jgi:ribosome-associated toxin RatA of RatAB toxin-antitoxin module